MRKASPLFGGGLFLCLMALPGCQGEESSVEPATPPPVAFEGEMPKEMLGHWETKSKLSMLDLSENGSASMTNVAPGRGTSTVKGEWRFAEAKLLFRLEGGDRVTVYEAEQDGNRLHLKQKSTKLDIEYFRKKSK